MTLEPILDDVASIQRINAADAASKFSPGEEAEIVGEDKAADSSVSVIKQTLGNYFFAESRRKEMRDASLSCHRVKVQCDSVLESLKGLSRTLTMNSTAGTRMEAEMRDRRDRCLAAVRGGDKDEFTAYKRRLNSWSVRLTDDIKLLETNKTWASAKASVQELHQVSSSQVLVALGTAALCVTGLVAAAVAYPPLGICIGVVAVFGGYRCVSNFIVHMKRGASTSHKSLTKVDELLTSIVGAAKEFDGTVVKIFEEGNDPQEQVQALEDLCRNGDLVGKLPKLVSELQGTVQAFALPELA